MCFIKLEDQTGENSIVVFPNTYEKYGDDLEENDLVFLSGKISSNGDDTVSVVADAIHKVPAGTNLNQSIWVHFQTREDFQNQIGKLIQLANTYHGSLFPVYYQIGKDSSGSIHQYVDALFPFLEEAKSIWGSKNVKIWKR